MNYNDIKLPPLPAPISREIERQYSVQQLEAYAREAVRLNSCKAALTQQQEAEPFGWFTEDYADDKSATTYSAEVAERWRAKGWPVTPLFTKPAAKEEGK